MHCYFNYFIDVLLLNTALLQGITAKAGVIIHPTTGKQWCRGLEYVCLSRATCIENIYLYDYLESRHFTYDAKNLCLIHAEYKRLRSLPFAQYDRTLTYV